MTIYIACDHGGWELKNEIIAWLMQEGYRAIDLGPAALEPEDDYPRYAVPLAQKVVAQPDSLGVLICRSGNGMAIAANKVKGAKAALCVSATHAQAAREHNAANILVLDSDYTVGDLWPQILQAFLQASPSLEDRHVRRREQIREFEEGGAF